MKRILIEGGAVLFLLIFIFALMHEKGTKDVAVTEVLNTVQEAGWFPERTAESALTLRKNIGVEAEELSDYAYIAPDNFMSVDEVLIVKADPGVLQAVKASFEARVSDEKHTFESYGTNQFDLLNNAEIYMNGSYFAAVVHEDAADIMRNIRKEIER